MQCFALRSEVTAVTWLMANLVYINHCLSTLFVIFCFFFFPSSFFFLHPPLTIMFPWVIVQCNQHIAAAYAVSTLCDVYVLFCFVFWLWRHGVDAKVSVHSVFRRLHLINCLVFVIVLRTPVLQCNPILDCFRDIKRFWPRCLELCFLIIINNNKQIVGLTLRN